MAKKKNKKKGNFKKPVAKQNLQTEEKETIVSEENVVEVVETENKDNKNNKQEKQLKDNKKQNKKDKKDKKYKEPGKIRKSLKESASELKRVSWPSFGKVVKQTGVVIAVILFFTLVIFGIDQLLSLLTGLIYK